MNGEARTIVVSRSIAAPPEAVWAAVQDQAGFVADVDDVRAVEVLAADRISSPDRTERVVSWRVWLKGFELTWQVHQKLDDEARRLEFEQIEGISGRSSARATRRSRSCSSASAREYPISRSFSIR